MEYSDTIAAIATPIGSAGIGIIRISGEKAVDAAARLFKSSKSDVTQFTSHTAHHGTLIDPKTGTDIDDVVLTIFRAPKSYTGENVIEISCHGGMAVLKAALNAATEAGARLAEPGEFTKRAFLNGKLDLAQAEAVNDLIRARTDESRKVALRQLDGKLSAKISEINMLLLGVIAAVEAAIDFPEDVEEPEPQWLVNAISAAQSDINDLLGSFGRGRIFREGLRMVIAGQVNVGKSSLLNALLRHARAIVTPIPGTTRDVIEESVEISGIPIVAIDTAGLRETEDTIEKIGVELTEQHIDTADLVLLVFDINEGFSQESADLFLRMQDKPVVLVLNKTDLLPEGARGLITEEYVGKLGRSVPIVQTCASSGQGIELLEQKIAELASSAELGGESVVVSNIRHKRSLESASESLRQALITISNNAPIDLLSVDLLAARNSLGLITGETASEDLLDRIFSEFCIGK